MEAVLVPTSVPTNSSHTFSFILVPMLVSTSLHLVPDRIQEVDPVCWIDVLVQYPGFSFAAIDQKPVAVAVEAIDLFYDL